MNLRKQTRSRPFSAMNSLRLYLFIYNLAQLTAWTVILFRLLSSQSAHAALLVVRIAQTAAWMEVMHTMAGIAGRGLTTTFIQSLGRYAVLEFVIARLLGSVNEITTVTFTLFVSWALGDVLRYGMYVSAMLGFRFKALKWLRYTAFFVLQPVGIGSEWLVYWRTLSHIDGTTLYGVRMPNAWNFAFDFGIWNRMVLVMYVYFGPMMMKHMVRQRKANLQ